MYVTTVYILTYISAIWLMQCVLIVPYSMYVLMYYICLEGNSSSHNITESLIKVEECQGIKSPPYSNMVTQVTFRLHHTHMRMLRMVDCCPQKQPSALGHSPPSMALGSAYLYQQLMLDTLEEICFLCPSTSGEWMPFSTSNTWTTIENLFTCNVTVY